MCRLLVNLTLFWTVYGVRYSNVLVLKTFRINMKFQFEKKKRKKYKLTHPSHMAETSRD